MNTLNFDDLIDQKLVVARRHPTLPLTLYKYSKKVFYKQLFHTDERLRFARGIVIHDDGRIISFPFYKVFNYTEQNAGRDWLDTDQVIAHRKVNGFLATVANLDGERVYSCSGSLEGEYVDLARKYIEKYVDSEFLEHAGYPMVFEVVASEDPHIVPEKEGVYLINVDRNEPSIDKYYRYPWHKQSMIDGDIVALNDGRLSMRDGRIADVSDHLTDLDLFARGMGVTTPEHRIMTFGELKAEVRDCQHEGFMVYNISRPSDVEEECIKIKSPYYLSTKFLARHKLRDDVIWDTLRQRIDEEFYGILDEIEKNPSAFFGMEEQDRIEWVRNYFER